MSDMKQTAPYPTVLANLVKRLTYRPGWRLSLKDIDRGQGSRGLTFIAVGIYPDTNFPNNVISVAHYFIVPAASYNEMSWKVWLHDRLLDIETHECNEWMKIDGERPFAPHHGPGNDPYTTFIQGSNLEVRTDFRGDVSPE